MQHSVECGCVVRTEWTICTNRRCHQILARWSFRYGQDCLVVCCVSSSWWSSSLYVCVCVFV